MNYHKSYYAVITIIKQNRGVAVLDTAVGFT